MIDDKDKQIALLRFRAGAAESALLSFIGQLQELAAAVTTYGTRLQELNKQFPIGDETPDGAKAIAIDAIRAADPAWADKTDAEIEAAFFKQKAP